MAEIASIALAWLSYVALYGAAPERSPRTPLAKKPAFVWLLRTLSLGLFAAAIGVGATTSVVAGALVATLAWTLAASIVPVAASVAPRSRALTTGAAALTATLALLFGGLDA